MDARYIDTLRMIRTGITNIKREMRHTTAEHPMDIPRSLVAAMTELASEIDEALPAGDIDRPIKLDLRPCAVVSEEE